MQCIYLNNEDCHAQVMIILTRAFYKPNASEKEKFCHTENFKDCPRFKAYQDYLAMKGLK